MYRAVFHYDNLVIVRKFLCLIFVGQATHKNLFHKDFCVYGTPCTSTNFQKSNWSVRNYIYQFKSTQVQCTHVTQFLATLPLTISGIVHCYFLSIRSCLVPSFFSFILSSLVSCHVSGVLSCRVRGTFCRQFCLVFCYFYCVLLALFLATVPAHFIALFLSTVFAYFLS